MEEKTNKGIIEAGDTVERVKNNNDICTIGNQYVVDEISRGTIKIKGSNCSFSAANFILISKGKPTFISVIPAKKKLLLI